MRGKTMTDQKIRQLVTEFEQSLTLGRDTDKYAMQMASTSHYYCCPVTLQQFPYMPGFPGSEGDARLAQIAHTCEALRRAARFFK